MGSLIISGQTVSQRHFGLTADASGALPEAVDGDIDGGEGTAADQSGSLYIDFLHFQTTRDNNRQAVMDLLNLNATIPFMDIDGDGNGGPANTDPDFDARAEISRKEIRKKISTLKESPRRRIGSEKRQGKIKRRDK